MKTHRRILWALVWCSLLIDILCLSLARPNPRPPYFPTDPKGNTASQGPHLALESPEHDFGILSQGISVEHLVKFRNTGRTPLHIDRLEETCGCTSTLLGQDTLQPGEEGEFQVTFHSANLEGPFRKSVTIHSNDARSPTKVRLTGSVQTPYLLDPVRLLFGTVKVGQEKRQLVRVTPRKPGTPLNVTRVWSRHPHLRIENLRALGDGSGFAFEVVLQPTSIEDSRDGVITLETGNPDIPRAWIRFTSRLEP